MKFDEKGVIGLQRQRHQMNDFHIAIPRTHFHQPQSSLLLMSVMIFLFFSFV